MTYVIREKHTGREAHYSNTGGWHSVKFRSGPKAADFSIELMNGAQTVVHAYGVSAHNVVLAMLDQGHSVWLRMLRDGIDAELEWREERGLE